MNDNISKPEQGMLFEPQELSSPLDAIRETDADGKDWWNSRKLARVLGYGKYWNFEHLMQNSQDSFWLSQKRMAELFGVEISTINYHLHEIEASGELLLSEQIRKIPISSEKTDVDWVTI